jgi:RNA polymerase sigma factor (sigma-70 family)
MLLKSLLKKIIRKEQDSERVLFEMFYNRVYRTAYMITNDHYLAQDVVQETFEKAFNRLDSLKDAEKTGAWLGSIATSTAKDSLRKKKIWNDVATEDVYIEMEFTKNENSSFSVENEIEAEFTKQTIRKHISTLKLEYRQVIIMKYIHELKDDEISQELGIKVGTVKSRLYRAKSKLKSSMESFSSVKEGDL